MSQIPEITGVMARAKSDEIGPNPMGLSQTDTFLVLKPRAEWKMANKDALIGRIREVLDQMPGISFTQPIDMRVPKMIIGVCGDLAIKIFGPELDKLACQRETLMKTVQGKPLRWRRSNRSTAIRAKSGR